jgi:hypothetical protein
MPTTYVTLPEPKARASRAPEWQARMPDGTLTHGQRAADLYRSARDSRSEREAWAYACANLSAA